MVMAAIRLHNIILVALCFWSFVNSTWAAEFPASTGEDSHLAAKSTPVVTEKTLVAGEETPVVTGKSPVPAEDTPFENEDAPVAGEETPMAGEETPMAEEDVLEAAGEESLVVTEETPIPADDKPIKNEDAPVAGAETNVVTQETPSPAVETPVEDEGTHVLAEDMSLATQAALVAAEVSGATETALVTADKTPVEHEDTAVALHLQESAEMSLRFPGRTYMPQTSSNLDYNISPTQITLNFQNSSSENSVEITATPVARMECVPDKSHTKLNGHIIADPDENFTTNQPTHIPEEYSSSETATFIKEPANATCIVGTVNICVTDNPDAVNQFLNSVSAADRITTTMSPEMLSISRQNVKLALDSISSNVSLDEETVIPHSEGWENVSSSSHWVRNASTEREPETLHHFRGNMEAKRDGSDTTLDIPKHTQVGSENLQMNNGSSSVILDRNITEIKQETQNSTGKCDNIQLVFRQHTVEEESTVLMQNHGINKNKLNNRTYISDILLPKSILQRLNSIPKNDGLMLFTSSVRDSFSKCRTQAGLGLCKEAQQAGVKLPQGCWELLCSSVKEPIIIQHSLNGPQTYWYSINTSMCYSELLSGQSEDAEHFHKQVVITPSKDFVVLHPVCSQNLGKEKGSRKQWLNFPFLNHGMGHSGRLRFWLSAHDEFCWIEATYQCPSPEEP